VIYKNTHPSSALDFKIAGVPYECPFGGTVEIPDKWDLLVTKMGLWLAPAVEKPAPPPPDPVVVAEKTRRGRPRKPPPMEDDGEDLSMIPLDSENV
jgi:hypothetical protein